MFLACIGVCEAGIIYVHSTTLGISCTWIHLGVHKHPVTQGICHESIDIAYKCIAKMLANHLMQKKLLRFYSEQTIFSKIFITNTCCKKK